MSSPAPEFTPPAAPETSAGGGGAIIVPAVLIGLGGYLAWFAVHYWRSSSVAWPSDPIKAVLQGKPLPSNTTATTAEASLTAYETTLAASPAGQSGGGGGGGGGIPTGGKSPKPGPGGVFTAAALEGLWRLAGGAADKAATAACIAMHESSGNPHAESPNPDGGTNVGLWQLDTPGGKGAGFSIAELLVPLTNARVAVRGSSNGTDWSAWSTAPMCGV